MSPDHPLRGAAATIYPVAGVELNRLRKRRHLQRLVAVCEGSRDPADIGFPEAPRGLELEVSWAAMRAWLESVWPNGARWNPVLLDRYLRVVKRKKGPAGYWTAHEAVFTMGEAARMLRDLMHALGHEPAAPVPCPPVPYESRGNSEEAWDELYPPKFVEAAATLLKKSRHDSPAGREVLRLLVYMSWCMSPQTMGEAGEPCAFLLLPRPVEDEAAGAPPANPLGKVRDPGRFDSRDPENVVQWLRWRAVNQMHNTFREYHAADQVLEMLREGNDELRRVIDAACATLMKHGQEPETIDMVYHLTSARSSPAAFTAILDRLEAGDLPPKGKPLFKDLPAEFLQRLGCEVVAKDPALRPRAEKLLAEAGLEDQLLALALRHDPEGRLGSLLRAAGKEALNGWTARCVAERVAEDPDRQLDAVAALGAAEPDVREFFWEILEELAPPWLRERRAELEERLASS